MPLVGRSALSGVGRWRDDAAVPLTLDVVLGWSFVLISLIGAAVALGWLAARIFLRMTMGAPRR
jgi:hypothetical protein